MPVHLGSMSESDQDGDRAQRRHDAPGDVYVLNDPYHGGTHLPDVTVVTPVFWPAAMPGRAFYVGSRGHHADIGGIDAGLDAAVLDDHRRGGRAVRQLPAGARRPPARERDARAAATAARWPARNPDAEPSPTCSAQIAANEKGVQELRTMVAQFGRDTVAAYMRHVQDNAEESVRRVITALKDGALRRCRWTTARTIRVAITRATRSSARRRSTSPAPVAQLTNNFNAPTAVTHGRGAVRVPHPGGRRHPAERRLPEAAAR